jgi:LysR family glycine cleavage system transcriptional activator
MLAKLPPLNALRAFEAAARHLSFTRAADELHVTQGAVSHRIRSLEEVLGRPLFRRVGRTVELSEVGEAYLPIVRGAFELLAEGTRRVFGTRAAGDVLTVTLLPSFAMGWLIPRLGRFQEAQPDIEVHLITTARIVDLMREDVDLGIRSGRGDWPGLHADRLFGENLVPVCCPALADDAEPLRRPADLARHTLIHSSADEDDWRIWLAAAGLDGVDPEGGRWFDNTALALAAAYAGLGVAIAPHAYVEDDIAAGWLVTPIDFTYEFEDAFWLVCPEATAERPGIGAFREWIVAEAAKENTRQRARAHGDQAT